VLRPYKSKRADLKVGRYKIAGRAKARPYKARAAAEMAALGKPKSEERFLSAQADPSASLRAGVFAGANGKEKRRRAAALQKGTG